MCLVSGVVPIYEAQRLGHGEHRNPDRLYPCIHVSQTLDQQDSALASAGVTKTFSDTMSGAQDDRPGLAALMEYVREGDTVVVWKLDRLGRNTLHILETVKALTGRGVKLVSVTDGIDSLTAAVRMMSTTGCAPASPKTCQLRRARPRLAAHRLVEWALRCSRCGYVHKVRTATGSAARPPAVTTTPIEGREIS